jgi:hypothetical protein
MARQLPNVLVVVSFPERRQRRFRVQPLLRRDRKERWKLAFLKTVDSKLKVPSPL